MSVPVRASIRSRIEAWTRSSDQPVGMRSDSLVAKLFPIVWRRLYGVSTFAQLNVMKLIRPRASGRRSSSLRTWLTTAVFPVPIFP
jgi:hypothetical protein